MIQVRIIRHSERFDFTHPLYWLLYFGHYWADSPLTINGHKIAREKGKQMVGHGFYPKYIYTSPYTRTMATATEIQYSFPSTEIMIEPLLSEYQPNFKHTISLYPKGIPTVYDGTKTDFVYPETYEKFSDRVQFIITKLLEKEESCIVVTHGELLRTYIDYLQTKFPDILLNVESIPYLTVISFEYDPVTKQIDGTSITVE